MMPEKPVITALEQIAEGEQLTYREAVERLSEVEYRLPTASELLFYAHDNGVEKPVWIANAGIIEHNKRLHVGRFRKDTEKSTNIGFFNASKVEGALEALSREQVVFPDEELVKRIYYREVAMIRADNCRGSNLVGNLTRNKAIRLIALGGFIADNYEGLDYKGLNADEQRTRIMPIRMNPFNPGRLVEFAEEKDMTAHVYGIKKQ